MYLRSVNEPNYLCDAPDLPAAVNPTQRKRKQSAAQAPKTKKVKITTS